MPALILVLLLLVVATLGFCGSDCQEGIFRGIRETKKVVTEPATRPVPEDAGTNDEVEL